MVVDNKRPMLAMMRAMLAAVGTGHVETYECPIEALHAMGEETPHIVIAAASMQPLSGCALVNTMRQAHAEPICFIPAVIISAYAKPNLMEEAIRAGAHQVLALPTAASTLYRRLDWLLNDDRPYERCGDHYVVSGMLERLSLSHQRPVYPPTPCLAKPLRRVGA